MSIHGDRANPYTLWLAAYDLLGEKPAQRLGSATPSGKRWSRAKPITEPSPQGRSNSPYVAGDAPGSSTTSPRPTSSTWSPAPSSATGPSGSTTAGPAQTGCCAVQRPRRITRRARFAMSTPWREGRATAAAVRQTTDTPRAWATRAGSSAGTTQPRCSPTSMVCSRASTSIATPGQRHKVSSLMTYSRSTSTPSSTASSVAPHGAPNNNPSPADQ
jgi:hypothetical protein